MATERMSSLPFSPVRSKRRTSDKLIFISCEGSVTEWEYFEKIINMVFANIGSKVKIINVIDEALKKEIKTEQVMRRNRCQVLNRRTYLIK